MFQSWRKCEGYEHQDNKICKEQLKSEERQTEVRSTAKCLVSDTEDESKNFKRLLRFREMITHMLWIFYKTNLIIVMKMVEHSTVIIVMNSNYQNQNVELVERKQFPDVKKN